MTFNAYTNAIKGPFVRFAQESARRFGVPVPSGETIKEAVKGRKSSWTSKTATTESNAR